MKEATIFIMKKYVKDMTKVDQLGQEYVAIKQVLETAIWNPKITSAKIALDLTNKFVETLEDVVDSVDAKESSNQNLKLKDVVENFNFVFVSAYFLSEKLTELSEKKDFKYKNVTNYKKKLLNGEFNKFICAGLIQSAELSIDKFGNLPKLSSKREKLLNKIELATNYLKKHIGDVQDDYYASGLMVDLFNKYENKMRSSKVFIKSILLTSKGLNIEKSYDSLKKYATDL